MIFLDLSVSSQGRIEWSKLKVNVLVTWDEGGNWLTQEWKRVNVTQKETSGTCPLERGFRLRLTRNRVPVALDDPTFAPRKIAWQERNDFSLWANLQSVNRRLSCTMEGMHVAWVLYERRKVSEQGTDRKGQECAHGPQRPPSFP